jgi:hypothetical protein
MRKGFSESGRRSVGMFWVHVKEEDWVVSRLRRTEEI